MTQSYTLTNKWHAINFTNVGAAITHWYTHSSQGRIDIVLGMDNPDQYEREHPSMGSIVGPFANRIANARFSLNGTVYQLEKNVGNHHLHGGSHNLAYKQWEVIHHNDISIVFQIKQAHLKWGYPGNIDIRVTYTLNEQQLDIEYLATSDRPAILNLTNHCYFNLNGEGNRNVMNHKICINASHFIPTNNESIPSGVIQSVNNSIMDLRTPILLSDLDFKSIGVFEHTRSFDHNFVLNKEAYTTNAAEVFCEDSNLKLNVSTDQAGLQFYLGNFLEGVQGKNDQKYGNHDGLCLEAQRFPDSPNHPHFTNSIISPKISYTQKTSYMVSPINKKK